MHEWVSDGFLINLHLKINIKTIMFLNLSEPFIQDDVKIVKYSRSHGNQAVGLEGCSEKSGPTPEIQHESRVR